MKKVNPEWLPNTPSSYLQYFSGGVPPLDYFQLKVKDVRLFVTDSDAEGRLDPKSELCFIGLGAYFESFCKDQFSAIINLVPQTLIPFTKKRECRVPAISLIPLIPQISRSLGFVIAEEYDFGSARLINGLFNDLLMVTPFSKTEMASYSDFLNDRNLLAHHGGVYTLKYAAQNFAASRIQSDANYNSLIVGKKDVDRWATVLNGLAVKLAKASVKALEEFIASEGIAQDEQVKKGIGLLLLSNTPPATI